MLLDTLLCAREERRSRSSTADKVNDDLPPPHRSPRM